MRTSSQELAEDSWANCSLAENSISNHHFPMTNRLQSPEKMQGARVLILTGRFKGEEGMCLGEATTSGLWAVTPDDSDEILSLAFEKDFGLLIDLSANPLHN
jgi:hypothetical protein